MTKDRATDELIGILRAVHATKMRLVIAALVAASAMVLGSASCTEVPEGPGTGGATASSGSMTTTSTSSVSSTGTTSGGGECVFDESTFDSDCVFAP